MTQEEKAKAYDEALERARSYHEDKNCFEYLKGVLENIFPELKESEDERIRKEILEFVTIVADSKSNKMEWIAWLEKQGEQKEYTFKSLPRLLDMIVPTSNTKAYCQKLIDTLVKEGYATDAKIVGECLKKMNGEKVALATMDEKQEKPKWSEEDEKIMKGAVSFLIEFRNKGYENAVACIDWLKSIKQRLE